MALTERETLEETIRECRGMIKDATKVKKELRAVIDEAKKAARKAAREEIEQIVKEETEESLNDFKTTVREAMDMSVDHVYKEFDKLANIMLHGNSQGRGESLIDVWEQTKGKRS